MRKILAYFVTALIFPFLVVFFFFPWIAAGFFLFVVPAILAGHLREIPIWGMIFVLFLYLQLWMMIAEYAFSSAASLYSFQRKHLFTFLIPPWHPDYRPSSRAKSVARAVPLPKPKPVTGLQTAFWCGSSYLFSIYGFALAFTALSNSDPVAFNIGRLDFFSALYFSLVTAATVGYGDIAPVTNGARGLVMLEIIVGLMYGVFFFSVLAAALQKQNRRIEKGAQNEAQDTQKTT